MQAVVAAQQLEMARLQAQQDAAAQQQQRTATELQAAEQQQQQQIGQSRLATQAMASSMKVLATRPPGGAPAAAVTRPAPVRRGARTTASPLRIGGTSQAAGAGLNIGG